MALLEKVLAEEDNAILCESHIKKIKAGSSVVKKMAALFIDNRSCHIIPG